MQFKFTKTLIIAALPATVFISSCSNSPYDGYDTAENGLYYKFYNQTENGVKPKEGDVVKLVMSYRNGKDSILFDSKKVSREQDGTIEFPLGASTFKGSFEDALAMMAVGDSASFKISADSVYLKTFMVQELPPYVQAGDMLTFEAKLIKVTSKEDAMKEQQKRMEEQKAMMKKYTDEENELIAKYVADKKIKVTPTESGLYYIEKSKGKGAKPTQGATVKVKYTGMLLDGTVFDTSDEAVAKKNNVYDERRPYEPIEFPAGVGQVIPGWDEALMLMNAGTKAQLIIPSTIGYGPQGMGPIPPFATLLFDVELVSVSSGEQQNNKFKITNH